MNLNPTKTRKYNRFNITISERETGQQPQYTLIEKYIKTVSPHGDNCNYLTTRNRKGHLNLSQTHGI